MREWESPSLFLFGMLFHQPRQGWLNGFRHEALPFRVGVQGAGFFPVDDDDCRVTE